MDEEYDNASRNSNPVCIIEFANTDVTNVVELVHIPAVMWMLYNKLKPLK